MNTQEERKPVLCGGITMTFICWQCRKPFEAVKYIEQDTRGVSPCCKTYFIKQKGEVK